MPGSIDSPKLINNMADHTLFYRSLGKKITILIVYVDDIIVIGNDRVEIERIKKKLACDFEMKDLGNLRYFLKNGSG